MLRRRGSWSRVFKSGRKVTFNANTNKGAIAWSRGGGAVFGLRWQRQSGLGWVRDGHEATLPRESACAASRAARAKTRIPRPKWRSATCGARIVNWPRTCRYKIK